MRSLLDTSLWISCLLTRNERSTIGRVVQFCLTGGAELVVPEELIAELRTTAREPRLANRIVPSELNLLIRQIRFSAFIPPSLRQELTQYRRDPDHDCLVAYGLVQEADYLVTGDRDLLALGRIERLAIVTPATFLGLLEACEDE